MRPFREHTYQGIVAATEAAGFARFGSQDSWTLLFRSSLAVLLVHWDRGRFHAECEPRQLRPGLALDDDIFRQVVDHEAPDPHGLHREWADHDAFVRFLQTRLVDFARVATSEDPLLRAALDAARSARTTRRQRWRERLEPGRST